MASALWEDETVQHQVLLSICSGLGNYAGFMEVGDEEMMHDSFPERDKLHEENRPYLLGHETLDCLRDLKNLLKMDINGGASFGLGMMGLAGHAKGALLKKLGSWNIVHQHLVPIFIQHATGKYISVPKVMETTGHDKDSDELPLKENVDLLGNTENMAPNEDDVLVYSMSGQNKTFAKLVLEILVAMTWPQVYKSTDEGDGGEEGELENGGITGPRTLRCKAPTFARDALSKYKGALGSPSFLSALLDVWMHALTIQRRKRDNALYANNVMQLCLLLIRNCLLIDSQDEAFRLALKESGIFDLMVALCAEMAGDDDVSVERSSWCLLLLEVFSSLFYGLDAAQLIQDVRCLKKSTTLSSNELASLLAQEKHVISSNKTGVRSTRHAKFGGSFQVTLTTGQQVVTNVLGDAALQEGTFLDKRKMRKAWRSAKPTDLENAEPVAPNVAKAILSMARNFMRDGGLLGLFGEVFRVAKHDTSMTEMDHIRFVWLVHFFFALFLALPSDKDRDAVGGYSGTVNILLNFPFCRYLLQRLALFVSNSTDTQLGPLHLHAHSACLDLFLSVLIVHPDKTLAMHILQNFFYQHEKLVMLLHLTKSFTPARYGLAYLATLIHLNDTLLRAVSTYCQSHAAGLTSKKKARKDSSKEKETNADKNGNEEKEESRSEDVQEVHLSLENFERFFTSESVVHAYLHYLNCQTDMLLQSGLIVEIPLTILHAFQAISRLFIIIAEKHQLTPLFYNLSTLIVFQKILSLEKVVLPTHDAIKDLIPFIHRLLAAFFKKWNSYPLMIVELFYPKSSRDILRIQVPKEELPPATTVVEPAASQSQAIPLSNDVQRAILYSESDGEVDIIGKLTFNAPSKKEQKSKKRKNKIVMEEEEN